MELDDKLALAYESNFDGLKKALKKEKIFNPLINESLDYILTVNPNLIMGLVRDLIEYREITALMRILTCCSDETCLKICALWQFEIYQNNLTKYQIILDVLMCRDITLQDFKIHFPKQIAETVNKDFIFSLTQGELSESEWLDGCLELFNDSYNYYNKLNRKVIPNRIKSNEVELDLYKLNNSSYRKVFEHIYNKYKKNLIFNIRESIKHKNKSLINWHAYKYIIKEDLGSFEIYEYLKSYKYDKNILFSSINSRLLSSSSKNIENILEIKQYVNDELFEKLNKIIMPISYSSLRILRNNKELLATSDWTDILRKDTRINKNIYFLITGRLNKENAVKKINYLVDNKLIDSMIMKGEDLSGYPSVNIYNRTKNILKDNPEKIKAKLFYNNPEIFKLLDFSINSPDNIILDLVDNFDVDFICDIITNIIENKKNLKIQPNNLERLFGNNIDYAVNKIGLKAINIENFAIFGRKSGKYFLYSEDLPFTKETAKNIGMFYITNDF